MLRDTRALIFATGSSHDRGHLRLRCRCILGVVGGTVPRIGLDLRDVSLPRHAQQFIKRGSIDSRGTTTNVFRNCLRKSYDLGSRKVARKLLRKVKDRIQRLCRFTMKGARLQPFFHFLMVDCSRLLQNWSARLEDYEVGDALNLVAGCEFRIPFGIDFHYDSMT